MSRQCPLNQKGRVFRIAIGIVLTVGFGLSPSAHAFGKKKTPGPTPTPTVSPIVSAAGGLDASFATYQKLSEVDPSLGVIADYGISLPETLNVMFYDLFPAVTVPKVHDQFIANYVDVSNQRRSLKDDDLHLYTDLGNTQITHGDLRGDNPNAPAGYTGAARPEINYERYDPNWVSPVGTEGSFTLFYQQTFDDSVPEFRLRKYDSLYYRNAPIAGRDIESVLTSLTGDCSSYGFCKGGAPKYLPWGWTWFDFEVSYNPNVTQDEVNTYVFMQWKLNQLSRPGNVASFLMYQASNGLYGVWNRTAQPTATSDLHGFPAELYGKSLSDHDLSPVMGSENYFAAEDFIRPLVPVSDHDGNFVLGSDGKPWILDHYLDQGGRHWAQMAFGALEDNARSIHPDQHLAMNLGLFFLSGDNGYLYDLNADTAQNRAIHGDISKGILPQPNRLPSYVPYAPVSRAPGSDFNRAIPRFAAEVLGIVPTFLGVKYVSNWQDPTWVAPGEKSTADWTPEDRDLRVNAYYHASKARLFNQKTAVNGVSVAVADLIDDNVIYLRDQTEVSYTGFKAVSTNTYFPITSFFKANANQRKLNHLPFVYQIVNEVKNLIATVAFLPFGAVDTTGKGGEVTSDVKVRYGDYVRSMHLQENQVSIVIDPIRAARAATGAESL